MNKKKTIFYERYAAMDFTNKQMELYSKKLTEKDKKIIKAIREENDAIRKSFPMDMYKHRILRKAEIRSQLTRQKVYNFLRIGIPVTACFIVLLFSVNLFLKHPGIFLAKGETSPLLYVYRKTPDGVEQVSNFSYVEEGEMLQIAYKPGAGKYGFIFSIDGRKKVTSIYPEQEPGQSYEDITGPFRMEKNTGRKVYLPHSYRLDNAPDCEVIFFITSREKFNPREKVKQVLESFSFNSSDFSPAGEIEFIILLKKEGKYEKNY